MCKRNIVFFLQQCVENAHHPDSHPSSTSMILHSLQAPLRGMALATIVSMLAMPLAVTCANVARAEQTSQVDISLRTDSPQSGDALDADHSLANSTLIVREDGEVGLAESAQCEGALVATQASDGCCVCGEPFDESDRFWLINTRHLTSSARCVNLDDPALAVYRMHRCSRSCRVTVDHYLRTIAQRRSAVVYVHGNRIPANEAIERGFAVHHKVDCCS